MIEKCYELMKPKINCKVDNRVSKLQITSARDYDKLDHLKIFFQNDVESNRIFNDLYLNYFHVNLELICEDNVTKKPSFFDNFFI